MKTHTNLLQALLAFAQKQTAILVIVSMVSVGLPLTSHAASSWSPTLLVNTESFQQIDSGDSTTDVDLRFGSSTSTLTLLTTGNFRFNKSLSVVGGLSGSYLTVDRQANISGSLVVKQNATVRGNLSGSSFFGAGLGDCNNSTTSKLIYNPTTGKFSCATDQAGAGSTTLQEAYDADADGSDATITLNTTDDSLVVTNPAVSGSDSAFAVQIDQNADKIALDIDSAGTSAPGIRMQMNSDSDSPNLLFGYQGAFDTNLYRAAANLLKTDDSFFAVGTISGSKLRVSGAADIHGALSASGSISTDGDLTINADGGATNAVLTFGNNPSNQTLAFEFSAQRFKFSKDVNVDGYLETTGSATVGTDLTVTEDASVLGTLGVGVAIPKAKVDVLGTISGSKLRVTGNADVHGILTASGAVHFDQNLSINDDRSAADAVLTFGNATLNQDLKFLHTEQRFQFSANLNVLGSISGKTLAVSGASSFSGAALFRTSVTAKGALSGATFFGAGLGDCNNSTTSKLIYNPATGKFSCATDQTGGGSSGGLGFTDASGIFVNQSGDTMTGALTIDLPGTNGIGLDVQERVRFSSGATLSGSLVMFSRTDPPPPEEGYLKIYPKDIAGRQMLKARGPSGLNYPYQPSFFQNQICMLSAGAGTTINSVGCSATNDTTVSHPAVTETYGFMANFATAATALDNAGTSTNVVSFLRGSTAGANGFFFNTRIGTVDNTDVRLFVGLANQTIAVATDSDNFAGHYVGFQYSTVRADTTWQLVTKNNTTQTVVDTGLTVSTSKVYDMYLYCTPQCTSISWRVDNITDGTTAEGSTSTTLPGSTTAMRGIVGVGAVTTSAKNIRMQRMYIESDR